MIKKKKNKIIIIVCLIFSIILSINFILPQFCYAEELGLGDLATYKGSATTPDKLTNRVGKILGTIQTVGVIVSVIILIIIGIKYMFSSVEERAEYKKTLMPYIIGAFLIFTGTLIPQLIYKFVNG